MTDNIQVVVRLRPLIEREIKNKDKVKWEVQGNVIRSIDPTDLRSHDDYVFDHIFDTNSRNEDIYSKVVAPLVSSCVEGYNCTVFTYGQTSSGKTFTMDGTKTDSGIIQRVVENLFDLIRQHKDLRFLIRVAYFEIYNEKIYDLLKKQSVEIKIRENVHGNITVLSEELVTSTKEQILELLKLGRKNRKIHSTQMNISSSRSHTVFRIIVECTDNADRSFLPVKVSHFNLVDLAGSERVAQTKATGQRLVEGAAINKSLSTLTLVISQLTDENCRFTSYRDSKLTLILRNALGGNAKTLIVANITPASLEDTHSTLLFAKRAKSIKNQPVVNTTGEESVLRQQQNRIRELESELKLAQKEKRDMKIQMCNDLIKLNERAFAKPSIMPGAIPKKVGSQKRRHTIGKSRDIGGTIEFANIFDSGGSASVPLTTFELCLLRVARANAHETAESEQVLPFEAQLDTSIIEDVEGAAAAPPDVTNISVADYTTEDIQSDSDSDKEFERLESMCKTPDSAVRKELKKTRQQKNDAECKYAQQVSYNKTLQDINSDLKDEIRELRSRLAQKDRPSETTDTKSKDIAEETTSKPHSVTEPNQEKLEKSSPGKIDIVKLIKDNEKLKRDLEIMNREFLSLQTSNDILKLESSQRKTESETALKNLEETEDKLLETSEDLGKKEKELEELLKKYELSKKVEKFLQKYYEDRIKLFTTALSSVDSLLPQIGTKNLLSTRSEPNFHDKTKEVAQIGGGKVSSVPNIHLCTYGPQLKETSYDLHHLTVLLSRGSIRSTESERSDTRPLDQQLECCIQEKQMAIEKAEKLQTEKFAVEKELKKIKTEMQDERENHRLDFENFERQRKEELEQMYILYADNDVLKNTNEELKLENTEVKKTYDNLKTQFIELHIKHHKLERENEENKEEKRKLEIQLKDAKQTETDYNTLRTEFENLKIKSESDKSTSKKENEVFKKENEDLKKQNEDLNKQNEDLNKQNEDLKKVNKNLKKGNKNLKKDNDDLQKQYGNLIKENALMEHEIQNARSLETSYRSLSEKYEDLKKQSKDRYHSLESRYRDLKKENTKMEEKHNALEKNYENFKTVSKFCVDNLNQEIKDLKKENDDLKKENDNIKEENYKIKEKNDNIQEENDKIKEENENLNRENKAVKNENIELLQKLHRNEDFENKYNTLKKTYDDLIKSGLEGVSNTEYERVKRENEEMLQKLTRAKKIETDFIILQKSYDDLRNIYDVNAERTYVLEDRIIQLNSTLEERNSTITHLQTENATLHDKINTSKISEGYAITNKILQVEEENSALKQKLEKANSSVEGKSVLIANLEKEKAELYAALGDSQKKLESNKLQLTHLKSRNSSRQSKIDELERDNHMLTAQIEALIENSEGKSNALKDLQVLNSELQSKLQLQKEASETRIQELVQEVRQRNEQAFDNDARSNLMRNLQIENDQMKRAMGELKIIHSTEVAKLLAENKRLSNKLRASNEAEAEAREFEDSENSRLHMELHNTRRELRQLQERCVCQPSTSGATAMESWNARRRVAQDSQRGQECASCNQLKAENKALGARILNLECQQLSTPDSSAQERYYVLQIEAKDEQLRNSNAINAKLQQDLERLELERREHRVVLNAKCAEFDRLEEEYAKVTDKYQKTKALANLRMQEITDLKKQLGQL